MDEIFGWGSSSEEEDEETREKMKKEEMERRQREIDEYRAKIREKEIDDGPVKKQKRFQEVSLSNALESGLVTIGDDDLREKYRNMMPRIEKHFLGNEFQYQKELEQIEDFQDLKEFIFKRHLELRTMHQTMEEHDEYVVVHEFLDQFTVKILKALTAVTKIGKVEQSEYNLNARIFEEYWKRAHDKLLRNNRHKFKKIFDGYQEFEQQKVDDTIDETMTQLSEMFNLQEDKDDIHGLIGEMVHVTMEEGSHIRETSPPPISRSFSKQSIDKLMNATDHMRVDSTLHQFQPRPEKPNNDDVIDEQLNLSSDSDDGNGFYFQLLTQNLTPLQVAVEFDEPVEPMEVDEHVENDNHHHIEMKPIKLPPIRKKKVRFVDFESSLNTMRIFCHPLDWYRDDGDDGITLAYVDASLQEGWKFLRDTLEFPYQSRRHPWFTEKYSNPNKVRVYKMSRDCFSLVIPDDHEGVFGSRIWYTSENSNSRTINLGLQEIYTSDELGQCIEYKMEQILHALRKCYSRERVTRHGITSTIHRMVVAKTKVERGTEYDNCLHWMWKDWRENRSHYSGKIANCLVLSDWRLVTLHISVLLNAELKVFPSHLGNVFFSAVMKFLRELFSYDWIDIKTLVFAFGGHESFELPTICRFLVFVQKLLASRNIQIHWISNNWVEKTDFLHNNDKSARRRIEYTNMIKQNRKVGQFIDQMRHKGMRNIHYYDITDRLVLPVRRNSLDQLEFTLNSYMQYLFEECNVILNSTFYPEQPRAYSSRYAENELSFVYNNNKQPMQ